MQEPAAEAADGADAAAAVDPAWLAAAGLVVPAVATLAIGVFPQIVLGLLQKASVLTW
jgi:hypothetical protein